MFLPFSAKIIWLSFNPSLLPFPYSNICDDFTRNYELISLHIQVQVWCGSPKPKDNHFACWFEVHISRKLSLGLRFNLLRSNIQSSCPVRFLKQHAGFSYEKLLQPGSYEKRHFTTKLTETASLHKTHSASCIPAISPLWLQQTSERDQPATILVFDIETTGFLHADHRIIEFALRDLSGGENCTFETLINPERNVPKYAAEANKITTELVCRPDVPRCVALPYIYAILDPPCSPVVTWIHISLERCVHRRWYLKINVK